MTASPEFLNSIMQAPTANERYLVNEIDRLRYTLIYIGRRTVDDWARRAVDLTLSRSVADALAQGMEAAPAGKTLLSGLTEGESPVGEADAPPCMYCGRTKECDCYGYLV